jgi:hypothetical protein
VRHGQESGLAVCCRRPLPFPIESYIANEPFREPKASKLGCGSRVCGRTKNIGYIGINNTLSPSRMGSRSGGATERHKNEAHRESKRGRSQC